MEQNERISITICGDGGAGKSSITLRLVRGQWTHEYDPTIEDSYTVTRTISGRTYNLSLTDTAGQEEYRSLWAASNLKSDAFLLVYDITQADSLQKLDHFNMLIEQEAEVRELKGQVPPVKIVAGNKVDLVQGRAVSSKEGLSWARERGCGFMETSARNVVNIEETFALLVRRTMEQRQLKANGGIAIPPRTRGQYDANAPPSPTFDEKTGQYGYSEGAASSQMPLGSFMDDADPKHTVWSKAWKTFRYWSVCGCVRKKAR